MARSRKTDRIGNTSYAGYAVAVLLAIVAGSTALSAILVSVIATHIRMVVLLPSCTLTWDTHGQR